LVMEITLLLLTGTLDNEIHTASVDMNI
jgi:hypothetical protein